MKEPWEWDEIDLRRLITDRVQESLTLDYKRSDSLDKTDKSKKDLSKDISAFANSAGGIVVYGIEELNHIPQAIDAGLDPTDVTREWIEQVINSTIQQRIAGIRIKLIELATTKLGRVSYVVVVPQSKHAPHMASDHRYYKRFNFQSVPMEDYEVRDVSRRMTAPNLRVELELSSASLSLDPTNQMSEPIDVNVSVSNLSPEPAMYALVKVCVDRRIDSSLTSSFERSGQEMLRYNNHCLEANVFLYKIAIPGSIPIWEGVTSRIPSLVIRVPTVDGDYVVSWAALSPGMAPTSGGYLVRVANRNASLVRV